MKIFKKVIKAVLVIVLSVILAVTALFGVAALVCTYAPGEKAAAADMTNAYITEGAAMVSAHRSGGGIAPENTMVAFKNCIESETFKVDVFEFDLHITADGKLILLHDSTLDRTTDAVEHFGAQEVLPSTKTYDELRELNFGENFADVDGSYPYRGLRGEEIPDDLRAVLLEDVLDYLESNGHFNYIIEIKDAGQNGCDAADELYRIIKERELVDNVVFGTFNGDVTAYVDKNYPDMLRSAGIKETVMFYLLCTLGIDVDKAYFKYDALQIPSNQFVAFRLGNERIVNYAHRHNLAVQYWTINEADEIARLNSIGADCIMSDNPEEAYAIINA